MLLRSSIMISLMLILQTGLSSTVGAEDSEADYAREGYYATAGFGLGFERSQMLDDFNRTLSQSASLDIGTMVGVSLGFGRRLDTNFAIEAAFEWMRGDLDLAITAAGQGILGAGGDAGTWTSYVGAADAKVFLLTGRVQPHALMGLGIMGLKVEDTGFTGFSESDSAFMIRFGAGVDVYITGSLFLSIDGTYLVSTGDIDGNDVIGLRSGLGLRF